MKHLTAGDFKEVTSKLDALLTLLVAAKGKGVNFNSDRTFVEKAKQKIRSTRAKYPTVGSLDEQSLNTLFRYFERAINDTQAFLKLVNGKMYIEAVTRHRVTLRERKKTHNVDDSRYGIDVRL